MADDPGVLRQLRHPLERGQGDVAEDSGALIGHDARAANHQVVGLQLQYPLDVPRSRFLVFDGPTFHALVVIVVAQDRFLARPDARQPAGYADGADFADLPAYQLVELRASRPLFHPLDLLPIIRHCREMGALQSHAPRRVVNQVDSDPVVPLALAVLARVALDVEPVGRSQHNRLPATRPALQLLVADLLGHLDVEVRPAVEAEVLHAIDVRQPQRRVLVQVDVPEGLASQAARDHVRGVRAHGHHVRLLVGERSVHALARGHGIGIGHWVLGIRRNVPGRG